MIDYSYTIEEAKKEIKESVHVYFMKDAAGNYLIPPQRQNPFYLLGAPGIGKTQMVKEIAQEIGCGFYATSLTHHTRNSILGLPVIRGEEEKYTEYTMPEILAIVEEECRSGHKEGILLLDEFASMPESLVAPMLAFLQNKTIGNHCLPEGWVLILASNPPEYNRTARSFDAAIMDRVRVMKLEYDRNDFLNYAEQKNLHPSIQEFIDTHGDMAYLCTQGKEQEIVTARGWENLSDCLYGYEANRFPVSYRLVYQFIKSENTASQFFRYYTLRGSSLTSRDISSILNGADTQPYQARLLKVSFDEKWRTISLLGSCLAQRCEKSGNAIFELDVLETLLEVMESGPMKNSFLNYFHQSLSEYLGYSKGNGFNNNLFSYQNDDRLATLIGDKRPDCLEKIYNELNDKLNQSDSKKQFGIGPMYCSNEEVLELVREKLTDYRENAERLSTSTNQNISNAIRFVRESSCDEGGLFSGFMNMLGKDQMILRVLSYQENEEYVAALREMSCPGVA